MQTTESDPAILMLPTNPQDIEVTIVMPCLNEALTVGTCVGKALAGLKKANIQGEVVIADNGSTDGSQAIATNLGARVVPVARRGYGAALQAGIAAARGRYVIMGDSDDSYDFGNIDPFVERLSLSVAKPYRIGSVIIKQSLGTRQDSRPRA